MPSVVFNTLLNEKIAVFRSVFANTSRQIFVDSNGDLRHPGEFGQFREVVVRDFLRFFIPGRVAISNGFVITAFDEVSTQCDLVAFDANATPLIESGERQRFFPVESVCAIGEVKSVMSRTDLRDALNKLARIKMLREQIPSPTVLRRDVPGNFNPSNYAYDQIPSFLICEKFSFNPANLEEVVSSLYEPDILQRHRHNLVLSLQDGLLAYFNFDGKTMMYPEMSSRFEGGVHSHPMALGNRFVMFDHDDPASHIRLFCTYLFLVSSSTTVLYPDMASYISNANNAFRDG